MKLSMAEAEIFVPDGIPVMDALRRTTHLGIGAHQDDLEIMAADGILQAFQQDTLWFTGVVVTDGAGSPRAGVYEKYTNDDMIHVRRKEQKKAAVVGEYSAVALLQFPSQAVKDTNDPRPVDDLVALLEATTPKIVYTHNLADKHDTHVAVTQCVLAALRRLPAEKLPEKVYGCEVWRDLDWALDEDKIAFDVSAHENLHAALVGIFDSQIAGGKRYDLATLGRRRAHATYYQSHSVDAAQALIFALDLTPLVHRPDLDPAAYIRTYIERFAADVESRIRKVQR